MAGGIIVLIAALFSSNAMACFEQLVQLFQKIGEGNERQGTEHGRKRLDRRK